MAFIIYDLVLLRVKSPEFKDQITAQDIALFADSKAFSLVDHISIEEGLARPGRGKVLIRDGRIVEQFTYEAFDYSEETQGRIIRDLGVAFPWELQHLNYAMPLGQWFCKDLFFQSDNGVLALDALKGHSLEDGLLAMHTNYTVDELHLTDGALKSPLRSAGATSKITFIAYPTDTFLDAKLQEAREYEERYGEPNIYLSFLRGMRTLSLPQLVQAWTRTLALLETSNVGENFINAARFAADVLEDPATESKILETFQAGLKAERIGKLPWVERSPAKIEAEGLALVANYLKEKALLQDTREAFTNTIERIVELFSLDPVNVAEDAESIIEILTEVNVYKPDWSALDPGGLALSFSERILAATTDRKLKTRLKGRFKKLFSVYNEHLARVAAAAS